MIYNLSDKPSVLQSIIHQMRDKNIQNDSMRFRKNLERTGEIFAYEMSKRFSYKPIEVETQLGTAKCFQLEEKLVLATILRAGIPFHQGFLNFFDDAENAFVSAYRRYSKDNTFDIHLQYTSSPDLDDKILILCDPMLATGSSAILAYEALLEKGRPKHTHFASIIACKEGIENIRKHTSPEDVSIWVGAIDEELTVKSYIVPGLGDAGDLAYGGK